MKTIQYDTPLSENLIIENKGTIISSITWLYALPLHYYDKVIGVAQFFSKRNHESKSEQLEFVAHATRHINMIIERETSAKNIKYNNLNLEATLKKYVTTLTDSLHDKKIVNHNKIKISNLLFLILTTYLMNLSKGSNKF